MRPYKVVVSGSTFTNFVVERGRGRSWSFAFPTFDISICSGDIRDRTMMLFKIAPNFWQFLPSQILGGWSHKKLYLNYHACLAACHLEKFSEVTTASPKVIGAHTLNFKPFFSIFIVKNCWETPIGVCASKPWSFSSACKNLSRHRPLRAEISYMVFQKANLGESKLTSLTLLLVDKSFLDFFRRTREERGRSNAVDTFVFWLWIFLSVPQIFAMKV